MALTEDSARLHLSRLAEAYRHQREELTALQDFVGSLSNLERVIREPPSPMHVVDLVSEVVKQAQRTTGGAASSLLAVDDDAKELVFVVAHGEVATERMRWRRLQEGSGIAGWVAANRRPAIVNSPYTDNRFRKDIDAELAFTTRCIVAAPLLEGDRTLGVIEVLNKREGKLFTTRDQSMLGLAAHFSAALLNTLVLEQNPAGALTSLGEREPAEAVRTA